MPSSLHFVIVEDDPFTAEAMRALLSSEGHRVEIHPNALTAVDYLRAVRPDVALLDIMMPGMDGIEICRRIGSASELASLKTVVVTAKVYDADRMNALNAGAHGVLAKPVNPETFVDDVVALVNDDVTIAYWGVRGDLPAAGAKTKRYGAATSCISLRMPRDTFAIFDAGTGIRLLSDTLATESGRLTASMLVSHPRWKKLGALPSFGPLFKGGNELEIVGPSQGKAKMRDLVVGQFDRALSTVDFRSLHARVFFRDIGETVFQVGAATVKSLEVGHPIGSLAYRVEYGHRSFCYVPYTEALGMPMQPGAVDFEARWIEFMAGAHIAAMGGADMRRLAAVAHRAKIGALHLINHRAHEDDNLIDRKLTEVRMTLAALGSEMICAAPAQGSSSVLVAPSREDMDALSSAA